MHNSSFLGDIELDFDRKLWAEIVPDPRPDLGSLVFSSAYMSFLRLAVYSTGKIPPRRTTASARTQVARYTGASAVYKTGSSKRTG